MKKRKNKRLGKGKCFVAAEACANHGQNFKRAVSLIKEAKKAGADAVKFQTYLPDSLTIDAHSRYFKINHPEWGGQTLYQLYKTTYLPWKWFRELKKISDDLGILFFSTAFDRKAVDLLEKLNVPFHKIASFELVDLALIEYAAKTRKPLILSTGMASLEEIKEAVDTARGAGAKEVILLKCVSSYPARPEQMNLRTISDMQRVFDCPIGLSDHTRGTQAAIAAVSLGAKMVEKHFTLSKGRKTVDDFFSIGPRGLKELVDNIRLTEGALGAVRYGLTAGERKSRLFRRSLFAVSDIKKGEPFTQENIRSIRPGYGLAPRYLKAILGKKAKKNITRGMPLSRAMI